MIAEEAIVSCYVDAAALLVMVLLKALSWRNRRRKGDAPQMFFYLTWLVTATCLFSFVYHAMQGQTAPWCRAVALIASTLQTIGILAVICLWLAFVDRKLYGRSHPKKVVRVVRLIPVFIFLILLVANLRTGRMFTIGLDNRIQPKMLYYVMEAAEFLLFLSSALTVWYYDQKTAKVRFLRISPMILTVSVALLPALFLRYSTSAMGYATGAALLYISMADEMSFVDEESGMYKREFVSYLLNLALTGKNRTGSMLLLETDGNQEAAFRILRETLHRENDVIRMEDRKFLMFSREENRTGVQNLTNKVDEAVAKHNAEHPEERVQISAHCRIRKEDEDPFTFLRTAMEDKEAGDEMKGIVSMISELDRLDKELKLAADIQLNMLPMKFPAFPDRTEFDLYASMTPAKEVGGDFYDFFLVDNDHLALVIADVSGKGIPAALFMMTSKTLIRNQLLTGCDPATALDRVNLQLSERNSSMMFVTVWAAVVEISTGKGLACNAGHENPGIRRAGGGFELLKYKHGMFLGVSKKAKHENREFELHPDDCVFVYTDGVPEANNDSNGMFGEERLVAALNMKADAAPEELIRYVHGEVDSFADSTPQFDDITMLCMKYYGPQNAKEEPAG